MSSHAKNIPRSNNSLYLSDKLTIWCSTVLHLVKVLFTEITLNSSVAQTVFLVPSFSTETMFHFDSHETKSTALSPDYSFLETLHSDSMLSLLNFKGFYMLKKIPLEIIKVLGKKTSQ